MTNRNHRSRSARRAGSRAAILAAAERIFAGEGLAGARTEAIAAEAGVNKAMLYYYFKSKEQLYQAVVEDQLREFNQRGLQVLTAPGPAGEILMQYVSLHFDFISARRRHACLFQQLMSAGGRVPERLVRKYFVPRSEAVGRLLERGMREGEFRRADHFHVAISMVAMIVFYFSAAPVLELIGHPDAYSEANLKRRKQEVLDFIRHGLFINPNAATEVRPESRKGTERGVYAASASDSPGASGKWRCLPRVAAVKRRKRRAPPALSDRSPPE